MKEVSEVKKNSIQEIEKVYKMYNANPNKPLNNVLNKGHLNANLKSGHISVQHEPDEQGVSRRQISKSTY